MSPILKIIRRTFKARVEEQGFERVLDKVTILTAGNGSLTAEVTIDKQACNQSNTMHGGFAATMVDTLSTLALVSGEMEVEEDPNPGQVIASVSLKMDMTYLRPISIGTVLTVHCTTLKRGKNIAFLNVDILNKSDGTLVAKGNHIKVIN